MIRSLPTLVFAVSVCLLLTACKKSNPAPSAQPQNADGSAGGGTSGAADNSASAVPVGAPTARPDNPNIKAPPPGPPMVVRGVTVNVDKLEQALRSAPYSIFQYLDNVRYSLHYEDFNTTLMDFQNIMKDPGVTEDQKTVIASVAEQVKQAAAVPAQ